MVSSFDGMQKRFELFLGDIKPGATIRTCIPTASEEQEPYLFDRSNLEKIVTAVVYRGCPFE